MSLDPDSVHGSKHAGLATVSGDFQNVWEIGETDAGYPQRLLKYREVGEAHTLYGLGDRSILDHDCLGLICSIKCPGSVILRTFDTVREIRGAGVVFAGGFHSPMEKECLDFLLRGRQPVVICLARYPKRSGLPRHWQTAIDNRQLLLLSSFGPRTKRTSRQAAFERNCLVATMSTAILVPYASSGGMAELVVNKCLEASFEVFTFEDDQNAALLEQGVSIYSFDHVKKLFTKRQE